MTGGRWILVAFLAALVCVWELWAARRPDLAILCPAPTTIATVLARQTESGELPRTVAATLERVGKGFLLGGVPALLLGLAMGVSPGVRSVADPMVAAAHAIPKIAVLPLFMVVLGLGEAPKIAVVGLAAFFPIAISTMAGVRQISPIHFEVARSYGASTLRVLWRVVVPGSLPQVLAGVRLGLNSALLVTIAAELVSARDGLGAAIWLAWQTMLVERLYATLAVTAVLGILMAGGLRWLEARLVPWHTEPEI
jgi:NitT/TauT family transport system permease protein